MARKSRQLACQLAAQVCQGHLPTGTTLLSYIVLFENYIDLGSDDTAQAMGWDVIEKPPVSLKVVRDRLKSELS